MRPRPPAPILPPEPDDPRLAAFGEGPEAWADGDVLTIAARRPGELVGTFREPLQPVGDGVWAIRLQIRGLARATIAYGLDAWPPEHEWRGPLAPEALTWARAERSDAAAAAAARLAERLGAPGGGGEGTE